jgi:hypothetical protein
MVRALQERTIVLNVVVASRRSCLPFGWTRFLCFGANLAEQAVAPPGALSCGRTDRHARPRARGEDGRRARPADRRRQQAGWRGQHRQRHRRQGGTRRLHADHGQQRHACHQPDPDSRDTVRCREGLRADRAHHDRDACAGGASRRAGEDDPGIRRLGEGRRRHALLCLDRQRLGLQPRDGAVQGRDRTAGGACALSRLGAGGAGPDRRPGEVLVPDPALGAGADPRQQVARPRRELAHAQRQPARRADGRRDGGEGLPGRRVVRPVRAGARRTPSSRG